MKTILCFFVLVLGLCLITGCTNPVSQKPNLVIKDLTINKSIYSYSYPQYSYPQLIMINIQKCKVEVKGYVKNEGNKEATGYYLICDYYNGQEHLARSGGVPSFGFMEKNLYVEADDAFSYSEIFDNPNICDNIKVDCKAYCKEC